MTQPFILQLANQNTTIDFLSTTTRVLDGGFDIGLPRSKRVILPLRPGFYRSSVSDYEYRDSRLRFIITGDTRGDVIQKINEIERLSTSIVSGSMGLGEKAQLVYAWDGATNITYFEVYTVELSLPGDVLSVEKMLTEVDGKIVLRDCELVMSLSPYGYGVSIYSTSLTQIPLAIAGGDGTKFTDGLPIYYPTKTVSPYDAELEPYWSYDIDGDDIPGSSPALLRVEIYKHLSNHNPASSFYMGLCKSPFNAKESLVYDSANMFGTWGLTGGVEYSSTYAESAKYRKKVEAAAVNPSSSPQFEWDLQTLEFGLYQAFLHAVDVQPAGIGLAVGQSLPTYTTTYYTEDFVYPGDSVNGGRMQSLGSIQVPIANRPGIADSSDALTQIGVWYSLSGAGTVNVDMLSLMPITDGFRILDINGAYVSSGSFVDDAWIGASYFRDATFGHIYSTVQGLLNPLRLTPGVDHRLYVTAISQLDLATLKSKPFGEIKVFAVPTYLTVAY